MISKEEAIKIFRRTKCSGDTDCSECCYNPENCVYAVAIEALSQPERPKGRWIPVHEHMWRKFEGSIDEFAWESGYHNGPVCELCREHICIHCKPDWMNDECDEESYRCSECNHHAKEKSGFCPNCGADMRG
jgi:hypothetical protein